MTAFRDDEPLSRPRLREWRLFRGLSLGRDFIRRQNRFVCKFTRKKNRRFRNAKISWPFLRFIYATQQRVVFFRGKFGVELGAKLRIHRDDSLQAIRRLTAR